MDRQRRQLNRGIFSLFLIAGLPLASTACSQFEAKPFKTGSVVSPPLGCTELLARDSRGDC
ncbi:hypothetical protein I6N98_12115 [Spongiibacter nanhainus]|uniref:Lipoprotein n=1 Tax=Spongiibacter nanhainus TaxID=2794344 RepID=A0A7T4QYG8_9GAMM|nr:hypothetical protein [Spongiibacter nanhainus]QQD17110.1 hypothetical protein I6N98_12115 [Spongiibacter nanhainus]